MEENEKTPDDSADYHGSLRKVKDTVPLMAEIDKAMETFIEEIKKTETYRNYYRQKEEVKSREGLKQQIDEFREKNFSLQNAAEEPEELFEKIEALEKEYAAFREDPLVDGFLAAELSFCRMMQKIYWDLSNKVDFE